MLLLSLIHISADELISHGYNVSVLKLNRIKPISEDAVKKVLSCKKVFFFEEGIKAGGIGSVFSEMMTVTHLIDDALIFPYDGQKLLFYIFHCVCLLESLLFCLS